MTTLDAALAALGVIGTLGGIVIGRYVIAPRGPAVANGDALRRHPPRPPQ